MTDHPIQEIEALAAESNWVRLLALRLVGDAHVAEDVAQEAFAQALSAREPPRGPVRAWMSGIVRNIAAGRRRSEARRRAREENAASTDAQPSAQRLAERVEQQRMLSEAVLGLRQPYRDTILQRFFEGVPQREIARREGISSATVNSRLTRAIDQLREHLDRKHEGNRSNWVAALMPLTAPTAGTALLTGSLVAQKKLLVAAAAVVLTLAGASLLMLGDHDPEAGNRAMPVLTAAIDEAVQGTGEGTTGDADREIVAAAPARRYSGPDGVTVGVIDGETGEPVPQANVFHGQTGRALLDQDFARALNELQVSRWGDPIEAMTPLLDRFVTDEGGVTVVPPSAVLGAWVIAISADRFGRGALVHGSSDRVEVEVRPVASVRVAVVDAAGNPLSGVPVALRQQMPSQDGHVMVNLATARSGGEGGIALLKHYAHRFDLGAGVEPPAANVKLSVALDFPLLDPVSVPISTNLLDWTDEPITLKCPPIGSTRVEVSGPSGAAMDDGTIVRLSASPDPHPTIGTLGGKLLDGGVEFWPVGVGTTLKAWAALRWDQDPTGATGPGPGSPGDTSSFGMRIGGRLVNLSGRLLLGEDEPAADTAVRARFEAAVGTFRRHVWVETDGEGRFSMILTESDDSPLRGAVTLRCVDSTRQGGEATARVAGVSASGELDLGDLFLDRPASLFGGVVVDPDGKPLPDVHVGLKRPRDSTATPVAWLHVLPSTLSDERGRFFLSGEMPEHEVWITAESDGPWYHQPLRVEHPNSDLRITMQAGGILEGSLQVEPEFPVERLRVRLWPDSRAPNGRWGVLGGWISGSLSDRGEFRVTGLKPGFYTFVVGVGIDNNSTVFVERIFVKAGEITRDARLDPLDVRSRYRAFRVVTKDEQGQYVTADAYARFEGGRTAQLGRTTRTLVVPAAMHLKTILIQADGYFPVSLEPFEGVRNVVLRRGVPVELRFDGELPPGEESLSLRFALDPLREPLREPGEQRPIDFRRGFGPDHGTPDPTGSLTLWVREPGVYRLRCTLRHDDRGSVRALDVSPTPPQTIVVNSADDLPHEVAVNRAVLERAVSELRQP